MSNVILKEHNASIIMYHIGAQQTVSLIGIGISFVLYGKRTLCNQEVQMERHRKLFSVIYFICCEFIFFLMLNPYIKLIFSSETRKEGLLGFISSFLIASIIAYQASKNVFNKLGEKGHKE